MKKILILLLFQISLFSFAQISTDPGDGSGNGPGASPKLEVGVTGGQLSISSTGSASYSIPFTLPAGINGVVPQIALEYNSQGGNGEAGLGWTIAGISSITRVSSTMFHDNVIDCVDFDNLDNFALDGQRLLYIQGSNPRYTTEVYSNIRVKPYGVHPNGANFGPEYFIVEYPDGSSAAYGITAGNNSNSRSVLKWNITYWQNPQGVRINYNYNLIGNSLYIASIQYGHIASGTPINEILFDYKIRNRNEQSYIGGISIINDRILDKINIKSNGVGFRNYYLNYDVLPSEYERLISITEKTGDNSKSYSPTVFDYYTTENTISAVNTSYLPTAPLLPNEIEGYKDAFMNGDFDIDGKTDLIEYSTSRSTAVDYLYFSDLGYSTNCLNDVARINVGRYEGFFSTNFLIGNSTSGYKLKPNQGWCIVKTDPNTSVTSFSIFSDSNNTTNPVQSEYTVNHTFPKYCDNNGNAREANRQCVSGDFNGDGLTDVIIIDRGTTNFSTEPCTSNSYPLGTSTGKAYFVNLDKRLTANVNFAGTLQNISNTDLDGRPAISSYNVNNLFFLQVNNNNGSGYSQVISGDVNGDGKEDIIVVHYYGIEVYSLDENNELQLIGSTPITTYIDSSLPKPYILDFNGDRKGDLVYLGGIYLSTGTTFVAINSGVGNNSFSVASFQPDFNNDGKADQIIFDRYDNVLKIIAKTNRKNVTWTNYYYGDFQLNTFFSQPQASSITNVPFFSSRRNGYNEFCYLRYGYYVHYYKINNDVAKDKLLKSITLGNGVKETITYSTLTNGNGVYTASSTIEDYPNVDIQNSLGQYVVSQIEKTSSTVSKKKVFKYYGAVTNLEGLGFLGFRSVMNTNWYNDESQIISNVAKFDIKKRGAEVERFSILGLVEPNHSLLPSDPFISKSLSTYNNEDTSYIPPLTNTHVFKLFKTKTQVFNGLDGTSTVTSTLYNQYKNPTQITTDVKNGSVIEQTVKTSFTYSPASTTTSPYIIDRPLSTLTNTTIFPSNDVTTSEELYTYNNNLLVQTKKKGHNTVYVTESNQFDPFGNITKKTLSAPGLADRIMEYEYDPSHRFLIKKIDIEGIVTEYLNDDNTGLLAAEISQANLANPLTTLHYYDKWGKKIETVDFLGLSTIYSYSNTNEGVLKMSVEADGNSSMILLDDLGRKIREGKKNINNNWSLESYQYDLNDRIILKSIPFLSTSVDSGSPDVWNTLTYDEYGRLIMTESLYSIITSGKITNYTYSGLSTIESDGIITKTTIKNALGKTISLTDDQGGLVTYEYFANGNLKSTNCNSAITTIEQDGWGRKTKLIDPSAGTYNYVYNHFGEIIQEIVDNKGITTYTLDNYGKVTSKTQVGIGSDTTNSQATYTYDPSTKLLTGIVFNDTTGSFTTTYGYQYDDYNRLVEFSEDSPDLGYAFLKSTSYDEFGRPSKETYSAQNASGGSASESLTNKYSNGYHWKIIDDGSGQTVWETQTVDKNGQILTAKLGNGISVKNIYDVYGFPRQIKHTKVSTGTNVMTLDTQFNHITGNLMQRSNNLFGVWNETLTYDNSDRLTSFNDVSGIQNQTYNANGTIASNSLGSYAYTIANKPYQVSTISPPIPSPSLTYYTGREQNITYNLFKAPVTISEENRENIDFQYNAFNQRCAMYYGGLQTDITQRPYKKFYSADGTMEIKKTTTGFEFVTYIGGDAYTAPAIFKSDGNTSGIFYLHRDYQGTVLAITNSLGAVEEKRLFDVWGALLKYSRNGVTTVPTTTASLFYDRGYTGHEHLLGVGLINMNGRIYDPKIHRFLQPDNDLQDPFNPQNYNRYSYGMNNPTKYTDPSGENFFAFIIAAIFVSYASGVQASDGQLNPFKWDSTGWINAGLGAVSSAASNVSTNYLNNPSQNHIDFHNNNLPVNNPGDNGYHPYVPVAVIQPPTQHHFLGVNMTRLSEGNFWQRTIYGFANQINIPIQMMMFRSVSGGDMRNLNGTATTSDEALFNFVTLPLFFIGGSEFGAAGSEVKSSVSAGTNISAESSTYFRYMTEGELKAIKNSNILRGGRPGETFFTKDLYKSAAKAQNRLSLPSKPTLRVEFKILNNPNLMRNGTKVMPDNLMQGQGAEFMTYDPVYVKLLNWQPLR